MRINNYVIEGRVRLAFLEDNISFRDSVIDSLGERLPESRFREQIVDPFGDARDSICDQTAHPIGRIGVMQTVSREIERVSDNGWSVAKPNDISRYFSEYTDGVGILGRENSCGASFLQTDSLFVIPGILKMKVFPGDLEKSISALGYGSGKPVLIHDLNAKEKGDEFDFCGSPHVNDYTKLGDIFIPKYVGKDGKYIPFFYNGPSQFENGPIKKVIWNVREKKFHLSDDIWAKGGGKIPLIASS